MLICTIYDTKSYHSGPLYCAFDLEHAKRLYACALREDSAPVLYPSDFELCIIGRFNEATAEIEAFKDVTDSKDYKKIPFSEFVPEKYKKYCLDGTFENQK